MEEPRSLLVTPDALLQTLRQPGAVLLDAHRPDADTGRRGALLFASPVRTLEARSLDAVGPLLDGLDAALAEGMHVAGLLSYEAGYALEPTRFPRPISLDPDAPLGWFGVYGAPVEIPSSTTNAALDDLEAPVLHGVQFALEPDDYARRVAVVKEHIRAGDVYQINLTAPFRFRLTGDALGLFAALRRRQRVAYGAYLALPEATVASVSPELFFRIDAADDGRQVTTRPMKGTAPRGATGDDDERLAAALAASPKDQAENLMIVDLLRNDLARVSVAGSVTVRELFETERFDTVTQMTSTVSSRLQDRVTLGQTLRALFPCGSITGAPKLRAMEIIRSLEGGARGVYCGAIGYAAPDGTAAFNVAIRTAVVVRAAARYDVGSGVVWDSEPTAEYAECLLKARVLTDLAT